MDQLIGQVLHDRYCIQTLLGRKPGRRTLLATDQQTQSSVVVKLLLFGPDFSWEDLKLFEREAETLKSLNHPAIPQYLDSFEIETELGKGFALVQSYIQARSLQEWMQSGRTFSEAQLRAIAEELLTILSYLHTRQPAVVHRDIKPSNILLGVAETERGFPEDEAESVYLVDFGSVQTAAHDGTVTIVGTYGYMAPEQFGGRAVPASDLYGVGATLIALTTGQHPSDLPQKEFRVEFESFTSLSKPFVHWLQWLTAPSLSSRATSAEEAMKALQRMVAGITVASAKATESNPGQRVALSPRRAHFKIQLTATSTKLEMHVPRQQIYLPVAERTGFSVALNWFQRYGWSSFFVLSFVLAVTGAGKLLALMPTIFFLMLIASFIGLPLMHLLTARRQVSDYQLVFSINAQNHVFVDFASDRPTSTPSLPKIQLQSMTVEPANLPKYRLNFCCYGIDTDFHIMGNRAEIQWLCDELNEWSGYEIQYREPSPM